MKAFISYSHNDTEMLELLHKHLVQLQREGILATWTDQEISVGSNLEETISSELATSNLFIALLSPDYLASKYCFENEFQEALKLLEEGKITIIPIIIEPCDWLHTPFKTFKAVPRDGKAITTWENKNTAFLNVIQNIRKLILEAPVVNNVSPQEMPVVNTRRNYRIQKDFDSIEKMEFVDKTFHEIKEFLKRYIEEIIEIDDNIKIRKLTDNNTDFESLIVNRNKIATESKLRVSISTEKSPFYQNRSNEYRVSFFIENNKQPSESNFILTFDEYQLFWKENNSYSSSNNKDEFTPKEISEKIWKVWLESVGIL